MYRLSLLRAQKQRVAVKRISHRITLILLSLYIDALALDHTGAVALPV